MQDATKPVERLPAPGALRLLPLCERAAAERAAETAARVQPEPCFLSDLVEDSDCTAVVARSDLPKSSPSKSSVDVLAQCSDRHLTRRLENMLERNASPGEGVLCFSVPDTKLHLKKRPLYAADNLKPGDLPVRVYRVDCVLDENAWVSQASRASDDLVLIRLFDSCQGQLVETIMQNLWQWRLVAHDDQNSPGNAGFRLRRHSRVFQMREAVPFKLQHVDIARGIKPTQLELYLLLQRRGWKRKDWDGHLKDLTAEVFRPCLQPAKKVYYHVSLYYFLCLLNIEDISAKTGSGLHHGQLQMYYQTAWQLAQDESWDVLKELLPNRKATYYKSILAGNYDAANAMAGVEAVASARTARTRRRRSKPKKHGPALQALQQEACRFSYLFSS